MLESTNLRFEGKKNTLEGTKDSSRVLNKTEDNFSNILDFE